MKKRSIILLLLLCVLLAIPQAASANAPAPDPLSVKIQCRNVEVGTVMNAMFAGEDGVFHPDAVYGERTVTDGDGSQYFRCTDSDTQMYLELKLPDGTVVQSNTLPITPNGVYRYDGKTNVLTDRTGSLDTTCIGDVFLFLLTLLLEILAAFALTILIEFLVGLCFKMKPFRYIIIANLITNIPMNIVLLILSGFTGSVGYWIALVVLEAVVVLVEYLFYRCKYPQRKRWFVLLFTLAANAASLAAGLLLFQLVF